VRLVTERLILREWEERDRKSLAAILGDPNVRRFYPRTVTAEEVDAQIDNAVAMAARHGFHLQAAERKADGALIGLVGIARIPEATRAAIPSHPEVEIGWQLDTAYWGQGYAPEAATAYLEYAWNTLELPEVVAFTAAINLPSQRVMEKIGMRRDLSDDFESPALPEGHRLRRHIVYRIARSAPAKCGPEFTPAEQR